MRFNHVTAFAAIVLATSCVTGTEAAEQPTEVSRDVSTTQVLITSEATTTTTIDPAAVDAFLAAWAASATTTTTAPPRLPPTTQRPRPRPTTAPSASSGAQSSSASGLPAVFDCIARRESGGSYTAYNPSSGAAGKWQMLLSTSNTVAQWMGRPDLVGQSARFWSPADQDAAALLLYQRAGLSPWGGHCP